MSSRAPSPRAAPATQSPRLILASASPRRAELLTQMGFQFEIRPADVDETPRAAEGPVAYVERVAELKAAAAAAGLGTGDDALYAGRWVVIGADTTVVRDGDILGKPLDEAHGIEMLVSLGGRAHQVITAVSVTDRVRRRTLSVTTDVQFRAIERSEALAYWRTGEAADKAGGYGIQGVGGIFTERISGSYGAVVGLPLSETYLLLREFGVLATWLAG